VNRPELPAKAGGLIHRLPESVGNPRLEIAGEVKQWRRGCMFKLVDQVVLVSGAVTQITATVDETMLIWLRQH